MTIAAGAAAVVTGDDDIIALAHDSSQSALTEVTLVGSGNTATINGTVIPLDDVSATQTNGQVDDLVVSNGAVQQSIYINGILVKTTIYDANTGNPIQTINYDRSTGGVASTVTFTYDSNGVETGETVSYPPTAASTTPANLTSGQNADLLTNQSVIPSAVQNDLEIQAGGGDSSWLLSNAAAPDDSASEWIDAPPPSQGAPLDLLPISSADLSTLIDSLNPTEDSGDDGADASFVPPYERSPETDPTVVVSPLIDNDTPEGRRGPRPFRRAAARNTNVRSRYVVQAA